MSIYQSESGSGSTSLLSHALSLAFILLDILGNQRLRVGLSLSDQDGAYNVYRMEIMVFWFQEEVRRLEEDTVSVELDPGSETASNSSQLLHRVEER